MRKSRVLGHGLALQQLAASTAFQAHVETDADQDRLFFLSYRHYLAQGLTAQQRIHAALCHYQHEDTQFTQSYTDQVYQGGGMMLWEKSVNGVRYDVRLMPGNDVLYEGGLSVVLHVDGGRVCVMSFSVVPSGMVVPYPKADLPGRIIFVTRKQLAQEHDYQVEFNKAFDRCAPAHFCFAALSGVALAQGQQFAFGIAPEKHPSYIPDMGAQFQRSYGDFWQSLLGQKLSPWGYLIDLPLRFKSLEELDPTRRKRALSRRAHISAVQEAALENMRPYVR